MIYISMGLCCAIQYAVLTLTLRRRFLDTMPKEAEGGVGEGNE